MTSFVARTTRVLRKNLGNGSKLPQVVGPYTWTLTGAVLHFVSLGSDPYPRTVWLADQSYSRTS